MLLHLRGTNIAKAPGCQTCQIASPVRRWTVFRGPPGAFRPQRPRSAAVDVLQQEGSKQQSEQPTSSSSSDSKAGSPAAVADATSATPTKFVRNIIFVASEAAPWSKTGGLGDVIGSLPPALASRGHRVMVVVPRYGNYPEAFDTGKRMQILGSEVGYFHHINKGVDWVFVDHPSYHRPGGLYADKHGPYGDNQFRFALLSLAALEAALVLELGERGTYGQDVLFVANDWHTSLIPVYLAAKYRPHGVFTAARSVLAIHNLRHQGVFPPGTFPELGLPGEWWGAVEWQYPPEQRMGAYEEEGRAVNHLKAGITTADRLLTVSPGYAEEIRTWLGGWGMEGLLDSRSYVLNGVVNGIDAQDWDPATDPHLPANYDATNFKEGKAQCKAALQAELGLPVDPDIPLVAFIGRLDPQKGADLVLGAAPWLVQQGVQLVCLGTGSPELEDGLRWLEFTYSNAARGWVGFNVALSHRLTAAADLLLMPSRFEPCGLNQLYAMRYGTVPIAHKTGGLKDTVIDFDPFKQSGTGWTFEHCDVQGLQHATGLALFTLRNHADDFTALQQRGMARDSSWDTAAAQYEQIFDWAAFDAPFCK